MPCRPRHIPGGRARFVLPGPNPGLVVNGNIDLWSRPFAKGPGGTISTVRSLSFGEGTTEILVPTVIGKRIVSDTAAISHYRQSGKHLGKFSSIATATSYARRLHRQQADIYCLNSRGNS